MLIGLGGHAISAGNLADFDAMVGAGVFRNQFFKRSADARLHFRGIDPRSFREQRLLHQRKNLLKGNRRFRCVDNGFELGSETHKSSLVISRSRLILLVEISYD